MKAIVYGSKSCVWCDRVSHMLEDCEVEIEKLDITESNNMETGHVSSDIPFKEDHEKHTEQTPQLFSEEQDVSNFKQEVDIKDEPESLIPEDDEENYEIPAFLRKQKN